MAFRKKVRNRGKDRRRFSRTAAGAHKKNTSHGPMRGGIRL